MDSFTVEYKAVDGRYSRDIEGSNMKLTVNAKTYNEAVILCDAWMMDFSSDFVDWQRRTDDHEREWIFF